MPLAITIPLAASGLFLFVGELGGVGAIVWGLVSTQLLA